MHCGSLVPGAQSDVVFVYTGAGAQYPGMGRALYDSSPVYRDAIDQCDALLGPDAQGLTLKSVLQAPEADDAPIHNIAWTQPALFAVEYALTELWRSWGVEPAAVIGHSVGEYAAACAAGVFTLDDGLRLIAERGRLLQALPPGGMMAAVFATADEVSAAVASAIDRVAVAAVNAPENSVISGETSAVESILRSFEQRGIMSQRLYVSLAAHSPLVDPALDAMEALARSVSMSLPKVPVAWNLTGSTLPTGAAPDPLYWRRHMREPVRFADGIKKLHGDGYRIFLEVGPHPTLIALAQQSLPESGTHLLTSLRRGKDDWSELLNSLGKLHVHGVPIDWAGVDRPYTRRRVALPTYPFERERYWAAPLPPDGRYETKGMRLSEPARVAVDRWSFLQNRLAADARCAPAACIAPYQLNDTADERFDALASEYGLSNYDGLLPELHQLSITYIENALRQLGFDATVGRRLNVEAEATDLGIAERHQRLFARMLALLAEHGVLRPEGNDYVVSQKAVNRRAGNLGARNCYSRFGDAGGELELLQRCGRTARLCVARRARSAAAAVPTRIICGSPQDLRRVCLRTHL